MRLRISNEPGKQALFMKKTWCGKQDSNLHTLRRWNLNPVRLPIPPFPRVEKRGDFITTLPALPEQLDS